jgi:hypothetical protein
MSVQTTTTTATATTEDMPGNAIGTFRHRAALARSVCEGLATLSLVPSALSPPPGVAEAACGEATAKALGALDELKGSGAVFLSPGAYARGILDLMKACASAGRADQVEALFLLMPRFSRVPELDETLAGAADVYSGSALRAGDVGAAEQACRSGFPEGGGYRCAALRLEAAARLVSWHLRRGDYVSAAEIFMHFVPGLRKPCWAPSPSIGETSWERESRLRFPGRLAEVAGSLFGFCEREGLLEEMEELYRAVELLDAADEIVELRLAKAAALARMAVEAGRLSDAVRHYGTMAALSHLDGAGELICSTLILLTDAYRDVGDDEAVLRLISGG